MIAGSKPPSGNAPRIPSLKVRYNQVFGYYIEITKSHLDRVPADYERKQTLVGAERFTTGELRSSSASPRRRVRVSRNSSCKSLRRFCAISRRIPGRCSKLARPGEFDTLVALAEVARGAATCGRRELGDGAHDPRRPPSGGRAG